MDTLENTNNTNKNQQNPVKPSTQALVNSLNNNTGTGRKPLKVQISEERIEHQISSKSDHDDDDNDDYENEKTSTNNKLRSDTQSRNDLEQLEAFYRKNLQQNLNTLTTQQQIDDIIASVLGTTITNNNNQNNDSYMNNNHFDNEGNEVDGSNLFGLQAIHIRNELEERTLNEILKEINNLDRKNFVQLNKENYRKRSKTPDDNKIIMPKNINKYKHVKSSGYGRPSWSPVRLSNAASKNFDANDVENNINNNNNNTLHSSSKTNVSLFLTDNRVNKISDQNMNQELMSKMNILMKERENDKNLLIQVKDEFLKRENEYRKTAELVKNENENLIKDLKQQIDLLQIKLNSQTLIQQNSLDIAPLSMTTTVATADAKEKKYEEQEHLIKTYQLENERLYNEMKQLNEKLKQQKQQFEIELQKLKIELINKNLQIDNYKQLETFKNKTDERQQQQSQQQPRENLNNAKEQSSDDKSLVEKLSFLEEENTILAKKLKFFEVNQKYIEDDLAVIDNKNKEIKKLNDKIKLLENNKNAPEYVKKLKEAQIQLKQLDQVIKRLRNSQNNNKQASNAANNATTTITSTDTNSEISMRIEYYEKRIEQLEKNYAEKIKDYDRLNRMWLQKYELLTQIFNEESKEFYKNEINLNKINNLNSIIEKKFQNIEDTYKSKFEQYEFNENEFNIKIKQLNQDIDELKNEKLNLENELIKQKGDFKALMYKYESDLEKQQQIIQQQQQHKKDYEPNAFKENSKLLNEFSVENMRVILSENAKLKQKYNELNNEFEKRIHEFDITLLQIKEANDIQIQTLKEQHRYEIEKFVQSLVGTGTSGLNTQSPLSDANLIGGMRTKFIELKQLIDEKDVIIEEMNSKLAHLDKYKEKCHNLETLNYELNENIVNLNNKLNMAKLYHSPEMKHYNELNEKLALMETNLKKREKEMNDLINNKNKQQQQIDLDFDYTSSDVDTTIKMNNLINNCKMLLEKKDNQILKFRFELDSMLELLSSLQVMFR